MVQQSEWVVTCFRYRKTAPSAGLASSLSLCVGRHFLVLEPSGLCVLGLLSAAPMCWHSKADRAQWLLSQNTSIRKVFSTRRGAAGVLGQKAASEASVCSEQKPVWFAASVAKKVGFDLGCPLSCSAEGIRFLFASVSTAVLKQTKQAATPL